MERKKKIQNESTEGAMKQSRLKVDSHEVEINVNLKECKSQCSCLFAEILTTIEVLSF